MFLEYPKALYHPDNPRRYIIVESAEAEAETLAAWSVSGPKPEPEPEPDEAADERDELRAQLAALGVDVDMRWSEKTLKAKIEAALE